jgi:hypothetical protein
MIVTHSYLTARSTIEQRNGGYGDNSPQYVFDRLIKPCPNIRLVFSGHVGSHGHRTDMGEKGNTVYAFLQTYHSPNDNPVRLFEIDTKNGTIKTWVYGQASGRIRNDGSAFTVSGVQWVPSKPTAPVTAVAPVAAPG